MRVRVAQRITGFRDGVEWPEIGGEIDLPGWEAENLIAIGHAVPVEVAALETPEGGGVVVDTVEVVDEAGSEVVPPATSDPVPKRAKRKA